MLRTGHFYAALVIPKLTNENCMAVTSFAASWVCAGKNFKPIKSRPLIAVVVTKDNASLILSQFFLFNLDITVFDSRKVVRSIVYLCINPNLDILYRSIISHVFILFLKG